MGSRGLEMSLVLALVVVMLCGGAMAQAQQGCMNALSSLSPCLNYITGNSSTPSPSCCSKLGDVFRSSPQCVCSVINGVLPSMGININPTLALSLPTACQVQTPSVNQCKAASGPTASATTPAGSPTEPADTPSASTGPSDAGTGTKSIPTIGGNGTSDGSFVRAPLHFILFLLVIVSCASTLTKF